ncbi:MAG: hypothetical protein MJE77_29360 [Proteobacteria bacterium]|nr:hypothetical protein [Pseudomonadota bacterium]
MELKSKMLKVLSPVENRNGKTYWMRVGNAFINRDGSTNVYLNAYPTSGKLHIREFDERDRSGEARDMVVATGTLSAGAVGQDELPF